MGACLLLITGLATAAPAQGQEDTAEGSVEAGDEEREAPLEWGEMPRDSEEVADEQAAPPPRWAVFVYPTPTVIMLAAETIYVSAGVAIALTERMELVVEGTFTQGNWYGCSSTSTGGWGAAGAAFYFNDDRRGFFILPKFVARAFTTSGAQSSYGPFGNRARAESLNGDDYELHVGVDVGYRFRAGPVVITPVFGLSVGPCGNCVGAGPFYFGDIEIFSNASGRMDRWSLGMNLNVVRIGFAF